jgi:hypothetical protein
VLAAAAVIGLGTFIELVLPRLFAALLGSPLPLRVITAVAILLPLGLAMGLPFPLGIKLATERSPALIPWLWGMNGAASVVGSVLAMLVAISCGFSVTIAAGLASYLAAAGLLLFLRHRPVL